MWALLLLRRRRGWLRLRYSNIAVDEGASSFFFRVADVVGSGGFLSRSSASRSAAAGYIYQLIVESGWSLVPTCFGVFLSLRVVPSSGEPGLLLVFEAPDPLSPGDAMAGGHLQPGCSAISMHVGVFEVLLMEAM